MIYPLFPHAIQKKWFRVQIILKADYIINLKMQKNKNYRVQDGLQSPKYLTAPIDKNTESVGSFLDGWRKRRKKYE